jgi:hypothetical protein
LLKERKKMKVTEAQREMRSAFLGGFAGQFVSGLIWLIAAGLGTWLSPGAGMAALFFGSMGIFPLTQVLVRMLGRPGKVSSENKLWGLGSQTAFTVPLNFLLVGAVTLYRETWFFPAAMVVVGSHYLPFVSLYGMKMYGFLAGLLVVLGAGLALYGPESFTLGGWLTGGILIIFAFIGRKIVLSEEINVK